MITALSVEKWGAKSLSYPSPPPVRTAAAVYAAIGHHQEMASTHPDYRALWDPHPDWAAYVEGIAAGDRLSRTVRRDAVLVISVTAALLGEAGDPAPIGQGDLSRWQAAVVAFLASVFPAEAVVAIYRGTAPVARVCALVIPLTADGRLCARHYVGSPAKLGHLQARYGAAMAKIGLRRGPWRLADAPAS